jgi:hypothetical protein
LYYSLGQPTHVKLLAVSGPADRAPLAVVDTQFNSITARFSPDGRWIAYSSNESGTNEVSVRPFDAATGTPGAPVVLTKDGGRTPLWRGDGKEIFYIGPDDGSEHQCGIQSRNAETLVQGAGRSNVLGRNSGWRSIPDARRGALRVA